MKRIIITLTALAFVVVSGVTALAIMPTQQGEISSSSQAIAEEKTTTFNVENMTCATCPITVRKAIEQVSGVKSVTVDYESKTAIVVFDPNVTTPVKIGAASTNAGYPAKPVS
jgi:mercuric ion binding protein